MAKNPKKLRDDSEFFTPPQKIHFREELKAVLMERNQLTAKSRNKALSILDDLSSPESTPTKPSDLRFRAINEILESEKRYIEQLDVLIHFFIKPLKDILDPKSHTALFGQIEMIYNLNRELLMELENDSDKIAKAFVKLAPFFKLYSVYAFDYKNAILRLQQLTTERPAFKKFLDNTETRPEVQMKLNSLLITPIQRIPRYKLLLNQLQLYTSPSEPDYRILMDSIREIENTVQHINSVVEDQEHTQSLINLQNSLVGRLPAIVKPSRRIVKEGVLSKISSNGAPTKYLCVLMSDIFMYCRPLKKRSKNCVVENSLQCCCIYPLRKTKVSELFSANFKISCQGDGNIFHAENDQECRAWVASLKEIIDRNVQSRKTLRKESSRKKTIRKKDDLRNFGNEFVLSPPQKGIKYDYENVMRWGDYERGKPDQGQRSRKRRHTTTEVDAGTELPKKKRGPLEILRSWFSTTNKPRAVVAAAAAEDQQNNDSDVSDPSYGFAERTYFRSSNVDSIPARIDFKTAMRSYQHQQKLSPIMEGGTPPPTPKRVKFNDIPSTCAGMRFNFAPGKIENAKNLPLKDRIVEFFSKLV